MAKRIEWAKLGESERQKALQRPKASLAPKGKVGEILNQVKEQGDQALFALSERFDKVSLTQLKVSDAEWSKAVESVKPEQAQAIERAAGQIQRFHQAQIPQRMQVETSAGLSCWREFRALESVGLYVPGGTAPLVSTVLMLALPAEIAGCRHRLVCTPPNREGGVDPYILFACQVAGVTDVYKVGGAQAVAAMAYGTESLRKVDKIFGPGNSWVTQAKLMVSSDPDGAAIDMPAGPSEVLVIAEDQARPEFIAADLLSQAEHGEDSQVVLVSNSQSLIKQVEGELDKQLAKLSRREIAAQSLANSLFIEVEDMDQAFLVSNLYAPEHLILHIPDARQWCENVEHAGSVFVGPWAPESLGDYASGTNHVLPTSGYAKNFSGLCVEAFGKFVTFQEAKEEGIKDIGPVVEALADLEGLDAHKQAVSLRLKALKDSL